MDEMTNYTVAISPRQMDNMVNLLHKIVEQQVEIKASVEELKTVRDATVGEIELDNVTLETILEVSDSTLYRWRNAPTSQRIPHHIRENKTIYYNYNEVLTALRKGMLVGRGFDRLKAIQNMVEYREDILLAKGGGSWSTNKKLL